MKRRDFLVSSLVGAAAAGTATAADAAPSATAPANGKILLCGGRYTTPWLAYMAALTGKPRPKLLFLAPAAFDNPAVVLRFYDYCAPLNVEPSFQTSAIASSRDSKSWDEILLAVDGIVVSGGNALNQQAIWAAHGVDLVLRKAWEKGIVLGGASAGSLAWFEEGTTDSRAKALSTVKCLGFLTGSHSPHYDGEKDRRPFYLNAVATGLLKPGYACDNNAGIYFEGDRPRRFVSTSADAHVYHVKAVGGRAVETTIPTEAI